jgi:hypothetical protein
LNIGEDNVRIMDGCEKSIYSDRFDPMIENVKPIDSLSVDDLLVSPVWQSHKLKGSE